MSQESWQHVLGVIIPACIRVRLCLPADLLHGYSISQVVHASTPIFLRYCKSHQAKLTHGLHLQATFLSLIHNNAPKQSSLSVRNSSNKLNHYLQEKHQINRSCKEWSIFKKSIKSVLSWYIRYSKFSFWYRSTSENSFMFLLS